MEIELEGLEVDIELKNVEKSVQRSHHGRMLIKQEMGNSKSCEMR